MKLTVHHNCAIVENKRNNPIPLPYALMALTGTACFSLHREDKSAPCTVTTCTLLNTAVVCTLTVITYWPLRSNNRQYTADRWPRVRLNSCCLLYRHVGTACLRCSGPEISRPCSTRTEIHKQKSRVQAENTHEEHTVMRIQYSPICCLSKPTGSIQSWETHGNETTVLTDIVLLVKTNWVNTIMNNTGYWNHSTHRYHAACQNQLGLIQSWETQGNETTVLTDIMLLVKTNWVYTIMRNTW